ncbi:MAG: UbiX family flavin prenyltransferase [Haliea sp.]
MKKRIIVGISGASGVIYGIRALQHLSRINDVETHLIITDGAVTNINVETDWKVEDVKALADVVHRNNNLAASVASGSFNTHGMIIVPCSIKTLSGVANAYADNLLVRAADVALKEQRRLILMVRETPLHRIHLDLMLRVVEAGAIMMPPIPAFYHNPKTIDDLIDQSVGKAFDLLGLEHDLFQRWGDRKSGKLSE